MEQQNVVEESSQEKTLSTGQLLTAIFTNPGEAFKSLSAKPNWIIPVIIILVISLVSGFLMGDITAELTKERIIASEKFTEEMKDQMLAGMEAQANSPLVYVQMVIGVLVVVLIPVFFVAAIFLLTGNFVLGGQSDYKTMLAVYSWGLMVSVPEAIIKIPMILINKTIHVYTSLALLFDPSESGTALFKFANAIDIFSLWRVALWAIGFGIAYKFSKGKSYTVIGLLYVVYVVLYVVISGALSELTGGMI
jgi:hypothetical protein